MLEADGLVYPLLTQAYGALDGVARKLRRCTPLRCARPCSEPASLIMRTFDAQVYMYERNYAAADSVANAVPSLDSTFLLARRVQGEAQLG